jgi:hypothetical protein
MLDSPLLYSGQPRRLRATISARPSGHSELRSVYLSSSLIPLYPAIKFSHRDLYFLQVFKRPISLSHFKIFKDVS